MASYREEVLEVLDSVEGDLQAATELIYDGPGKVARYVIQLGLESVQAKRRRMRRREFKAEIKPQFTPGRTTGRVVLTKASKERLLRNTQELFGDDGWMIGNLNLGEFSKEQLLAQASAERASAKGSIRNAQFYEALAEPLQPGQLVRDYWQSKDARGVKDKIWRDTEGQSPSLT